jgi:ubiquinone/menaquinone biosynthesis C-methylase UbiE
MDPELRRRMLAYYDERASEYEEAYTLGTGTASITEPEVFKAEALLLAGADNCSHMTLFDQSDNMLAEAREKAARLGVLDRCEFVLGDFFDQKFGEHFCDTVLVVFF